MGGARRLESASGRGKEADIFVRVHAGGAARLGLEARGLEGAVRKLGLEGGCTQEGQGGWDRRRGACGRNTLSSSLLTSDYPS